MVIVTPAITSNIVNNNIILTKTFKIISFIFLVLFKFTDSLSFKIFYKFSSRNYCQKQLLPYQSSIECSVRVSSTLIFIQKLTLAWLRQISFWESTLNHFWYNALMWWRMLHCMYFRCLIMFNLLSKPWIRNFENFGNSTIFLFIT